MKGLTFQALGDRFLSRGPGFWKGAQEGGEKSSSFLVVKSQCYLIGLHYY
jgi:hypothetical protein